MSRRFVLRMLMPIAVVCVFAVSAQPAQAGFGSFLKKLFFGGSGQSTEQSTDDTAQAQPRAASSGANTNNASSPFRAIGPDGTVYNNGATIEATGGQVFTIEWGYPGQCTIYSAYGRERKSGYSEMSYTVPGFSYPVKIECTYQVSPGTDSDDPEVEINKGEIFFVIKDSLGEEISHDNNRAQFGFEADKQKITQGETVTLSWSIHPAFVNADGVDVYTCTLESNLDRQMLYFDREKMESMADDAKRIHVPVVPQKAGTHEYTLSCKYKRRGARNIYSDVEEQSTLKIVVDGTGTSDGGDASGAGASGGAAAGGGESSDTEGGSTGGPAGSDTDASVTSNFTVTPETIEQGEGLVAMTFDVKDEYRPEHGGKTCYVYHALPGVTIGGSENWWDWREKGVFSHTYYFYTDELEQLGKHTFVVSCSKDGKIYNEFRYVTVNPFSPTQSSLFKVDDDTIESGNNVRVIGITWNVPRSKFCRLSSTGGDLKNTPEEISIGWLRKVFPNSGSAELHVSERMESGDATVNLICSDPSKGRRSHIVFAQTITLKHVDGTETSSGGEAGTDTSGGATGSADAGAGTETDTDADAGSGSTGGPKRGEDFTFDVTKGAPAGDRRVNVTVRLEVKTAGVSCSVSSTDNSVSVQGIGKGNSLSVTEPATLPVTYTALCANSGKTTVVKETVKKEDVASGNSGSSEGSGTSGATSDNNGGNSANSPVEGTDFEFEVWKYEEQDLVGTSIKILKDDVECSVSGAGIRKDVIANKDRAFNGSGALRVDFPAAYTATCKRGNATTVITKTIKADGEVGVVADSDANSSSGGSDSGTSDSDDATAGGDANDGNNAATAEAGGTATTGTTTLTATPATVKPSKPFTLTWSSQKNYCSPAGSWDIDDVRKKNPGLINKVRIWGMTFSWLKPNGVFQHEGITKDAKFAIRCYDDPTQKYFFWLHEKSVATVKVADAGNSSSSSGSSNNGGTASTGTLIAAFDVTPKNIPRDGEVTVYFKTTDVQQKCELSGVQGDVVQILNNAVSQESQAFTRPVALGARFDDGVVRVMLTCTSIADASVTEQRVQDVRVGAHAGIRYFTADTYHLDAPGDVWLSWDTFGMKSCSVKRDVLDNGNMFDLMRRSWSSSDGSYRVSKTTQFTLTCQPKDKNEAVQKRTLVVSVGDYTAEKPIEGTEDAEYVRYCPFKIDNTIDHLVNFSQRLEWAGQKEIVNGANVPAGVYKVWLSASDSLAGRSYQDQPNERYYVEFYDADGKVLAQTGPTNDLSNDTATGAVTLVTDKFILPRMAASVAAVHADGESASLNPGCMLLKRVGDMATDDDANQVVCTADVKLCPDGSYVGRVAPSCNFAACPGDTGASGDDNAGTTNSQTTSAGNQRLQPVTRSATRALQPSCKSNWSSNVSGNFARPDGLVDVTCAGDDVVVHVGKEGDNNYYTWSEAYYTTDGDNLSNKTTVNGQRDATGKWVVGKGEVVIPQAPRSVNYVATYTCVRSNGAWQCGCADGTQNCSQPEQGKFIWYLTGYNR